MTKPLPSVNKSPKNGNFQINTTTTIATAIWDKNIKSYQSLIKNGSQISPPLNSKNNDKIRDITDQLLHQSHIKAKIKTSILGLYQNFP